MSVSIAITGAGGRMGRRLIALSLEYPGQFNVVAAIDAPASPAIGHDAGTLAGIGALGVPVSTTMAATPDVIIDFSIPAATRVLIPQCADRGIALLIGTTGLTAEDQVLIDQAADSIPILHASNMSLGVNLLLSVAAQVARQLGPDYDIEIVEAHHNAKKDAPSGTALSLAESICKATDRDIQSDLVHGRVGHDAPRRKGTIGMHALRMGDVVGEHTVHFAAHGERIEVKHIATTRDTFVRGALRAAAFLADAVPGRYTMADVLGL